ncbi:MAG: HD domain-containing protein [Chloroflexota bacterium]
MPPSPADAPSRRVAPLHPIDRDWFRRWSGHLDARRHGAVSDLGMVSTLVRAQHEAPPASGALRWLTASQLPAVARADTPLGARTPLPRSMGVAPVLAHGQARRTAEVLAVLSACLDPAERRVEGHAIRVATLASRLAADLEMGDDARCDLLYAGLLRDAGSTGLEPEDVPPATTARNRRFALSRPRRQPGEAASPPPPDRPYLSRPDRAAAMVRVLGLPPGVLEAVASAEERWDGHGPRRERHRNIPTGARVLALAVLAAEAAGTPGATAAALEKVLRRERGRILDPELVDRVLALGRDGRWADLLLTTPSLERMLEQEPLHRVRVTDDAGLDAIAGAFADLVDTRTPMMGRHGRRVADFAARTSVALGLEPRVADDVRRAALLHDIGRLLVPIAFLEKPGRLNEHERQVVDGHAAAGAAVLARSRVLGGLAPLIAAHHEKLSGTGHFPQMLDDDREMGARIIALADRFEAMTAPRPWRPAMTAKQAWAELAEETSEPLAVVVLRVMERTLGG